MTLINKYIIWLLRIPVALTFLVHGYPKLGASPADLGYVGYLVGPFEFFGAIFLLVGPFVNDIISRIGSSMVAFIMVGAIYMHLFKWNDTIGSVEWQILLLCVSLFLLVKGNES
jgi:uncharacterized membrane protein YphA (DoxX/SURF4 family)|tara:strand:+ start:1674 stop:2015 length:342 start_codon:yes stop_codon:yes gene_type:complete